jgi:GNAT superfamily N-acetyltransferase
LVPGSTRWVRALPAGTLEKTKKDVMNMCQPAAIIRPMTETDIFDLAQGFAEQGWNKPQSQYEAYWQEHQSGVRTVLTAEADGKAVGYLTVVPNPEHGPFAGKGYPEIVDFNVLIPYRNQGIGNLLMDAAEAYIAKTSPIATIGVGLYRDYGTAQRMYVKRGYIPDGSGVWYQNRNLDPCEICYNDDDLVLYFSKQLG